MIEPSAFAKAGRSAVHSRMVPERLTSITCSNTSISNSAARRMMPAAFTSTSSRSIPAPKAATASVSLTSSATCR